jgi:hypothetical protein
METERPLRAKYDNKRHYDQDEEIKFSFNEGREGNDEKDLYET